LGRDNSSKNYNELKSLCKKKYFLYCCTNLKFKAKSRKIKSIDPTISSKTNPNKNSSFAPFYKSISYQKYEDRSPKKNNFLETSNYLNITGNKSQNKSSTKKTINSHKSHINNYLYFLTKSNLDNLNLNRTYAKINKDEANIIDIYNFKKGLNSLLGKSRKYSKEKTIFKNSDSSYHKVNTTTLSSCKECSEHSLMNPRNFSNNSKKEIPNKNFNKTIQATNIQKIIRNSDASNNSYNKYNLKMNYLKFEGKGGKGNFFNNYNFKNKCIIVPRMSSKKDGSLSKNSIANKSIYSFIENTRSSIINTSSSNKKKLDKLNFPNQNLDYKNTKKDFTLIRKKSLNSKLKILSQKNKIDTNNNKKEVNMKFTDFIMYKENEIKDKPYKNIKNEENISKFSNKRKNEMSFSTIKNVILDIKNSNECPNNYLNSENSVKIHLH